MSAERAPKPPKAQGTNGYEFGPFVLDTARHLLLKGDRTVALTPKTYDLLLLLVESGGRLLLKEELMKALWPNSFVEESNLTQQISTIRKALRESPGEDRYIVTVASKGYRFAAPVKPLAQDGSDAPTGVSSQTDQNKNSTAREVLPLPEEWRRAPSEPPSISQTYIGASGLLHRPRIALILVISLAI